MSDKTRESLLSRIFGCLFFRGKSKREIGESKDYTFRMSSEKQEAETVCTKSVQSTMQVEKVSLEALKVKYPKLISIEFPPIRYNIPEGGKNPFDITSENLYFVNASGLSNLFPNRDKFTVGYFDKHIPGGYKSIVEQERVMLVYKDEEFIFGSTYDSSLFPDAKYCLNTSKSFNIQYYKPHIVETTSLSKPECNDVSLYSYLWDDYERCVEYARQYSIKKDCAVLISKYLCYWDRY